MTSRGRGLRYAGILRMSYARNGENLPFGHYRAFQATVKVARSPFGHSRYPRGALRGIWCHADRQPTACSPPRCSTRPTPGYSSTLNKRLIPRGRRSPAAAVLYLKPLPGTVRLDHPGIAPVPIAFGEEHRFTHFDKLPTAVEVAHPNRADLRLPDHVARKHPPVPLSPKFSQCNRKPLRIACRRYCDRTKRLPLDQTVAVAV